MFSAVKINSDTLLDELFDFAGLPTFEDSEETIADSDNSTNKLTLSLQLSDSPSPQSPQMTLNADERESTRQAEVIRKLKEIHVKDMGPMPSDERTLEKEMTEMRRRITCDICLDRPRGVLFLPCRHLLCCGICAASVNKCPCCRAQIVATIKAFILPKSDPPAT